MKLLKKHEDRFTSRGFGQGLGALAHVSKSRKKRDDVREFLTSYVNHPKTTVRTAAISALGTLGDEKAMSIVDAFTNSQNTRISLVAKQAIGKLRESKSTAPREVIELRKDLAELKKSSDKLSEELKDIRKQLSAKGEMEKDPESE